MTRDELIRRLEAGETGREMDALVCSAVGGRVEHYATARQPNPTGMWLPPGKRDSPHDAAELPKCTTSLDAALALLGEVLPGWDGMVEWWCDGDAVASIDKSSKSITSVSDGTLANGRAPTAAAALCAAILEAKGGQDDG